MSEQMTRLEQGLLHLRRFTDATYAYLMGRQVDELRERWRRTQELMGESIRRVDLHSHTTYSDGTASVAEMDEWRQRTGIDVLGITDHNTLAQADDCRRYPQLLVGEEVTGEHHHVLIHFPESLIMPVHQLAGEVENIRRQQRIPLIAHPTGWMGRVYEATRIDAVRMLSGPFLMEIANGAGNWYDYRDSTDESARGLWDELLLAGIPVIATGNSDAHRGANVGLVWNGVPTAAEDPGAIYQALLSGCGFVSNGPAVVVSADGMAPGSPAIVPQRQLALHIRTADSAGLARWRVVGDGSTVQEGDCGGKTLLDVDLDLPASHVHYYRVEAVSSDGRQAFSNPFRFSLQSDA